MHTPIVQRNQNRSQNNWAFGISTIILKILIFKTPYLALSVRNRNVLEEIWNYFRFPKLNFKNYTENSDKRYKIC